MKTDQTAIITEGQADLFRRFLAATGWDGNQETRPESISLFHSIELMETDSKQLEARLVTKLTSENPEARFVPLHLVNWIGSVISIRLQDFRIYLEINVIIKEPEAPEAPDKTEKLSREHLRICAEECLGKYMEYYNDDDSHGERFESSEERVYALNIPTDEMSGKLYAQMVEDLTYRSHGVEGNAGGAVIKVSVAEVRILNDNFWRVTVHHSYVLDI